MLTDWDRCFPNCEPIGHRLRETFPERWVRFHSLPESKRYPEDEAEYVEALSRHNCVLTALARPGKAVVLLTTGYSGLPEPVRSYPQLAVLDPQAVPWRSVAMHLADEGFAEPAYWHLFASRRVWRPGELDPVVRLVADDEVANVLVVAEDCRWVLHPYDGGMDVIAESLVARDQLREAHSAWLSERPDGL
jgi:hypothetical protein